ncbi:MAG: hypothetical protein Hyperionvirus15_49 [Hyperionvirus sp.]|uniref:Uncharacterized protein n=1 Tax=Hyperionvirus sp. TaxID=2487770 RepID=A0A3G5ACM5_9VIRU|nr:MAG: hypothetical protein Hyperionvirus15_49 [Hyperionvirus sp.]
MNALAIQWGYLEIVMNLYTGFQHMVARMKQMYRTFKM